MIYKFTDASSMAADIQRAKSDSRAFIIKKIDGKWYVEIPKICEGNSFNLYSESNISGIHISDIKNNNLIKTDGSDISEITEENYYPASNVDSKLNNTVDSAIYKLATYGKTISVDSVMKDVASVNESSGISVNIIKDSLRSGKNIKIYPNNDFNASTNNLLNPQIIESESDDNKHQFKGLGKRRTSSPLLSLLSRSKVTGSNIEEGFFNHSGNQKYSNSVADWNILNTVKWSTSNSYI